MAETRENVSLTIRNTPTNATRRHRLTPVGAAAISRRAWGARREGPPGGCGKPRRASATTGPSSFTSRHLPRNQPNAVRHVCTRALAAALFPVTGLQTQPCPSADGRNAVRGHGGMSLGHKQERGPAPGTHGWTGGFTRSDVNPTRSHLRVGSTET